MASGVIVLAEDDARLRRLYTDVLDAQGYTVKAVKDGREAVELIRNVRPEAVILDIKMPRMNGIEACWRARKLLHPDVPILFLTAHDRMEMLLECLQAGGDDFLVKSDDLSSLIARVNYWVTQPSRRGQSRRRNSALAEVVSHLVQAGEAWTRDDAPSSESDAAGRSTSDHAGRARKRAESGRDKEIENTQSKSSETQARKSKAEKAQVYGNSNEDDMLQAHSDIMELREKLHETEIKLNEKTMIIMKLIEDIKRRDADLSKISKYKDRIKQLEMKLHATERMNSGKNISKVKKAFARLYHPDKLEKTGFERIIRSEIFKEFWSELDSIENDLR